MKELTYDDIENESYEMKEYLERKNETNLFLVAKNEMYHARAEFEKIKAEFDKKKEQYDKLMDIYSDIVSRVESGELIAKIEINNVRKMISTVSSSIENTKQKLAISKSNTLKRETLLREMFPEYTKYMDEVLQAELVKTSNTEGRLVEIKNERSAIHEKMNYLSDFDKIMNADPKGIKNPFQKYISSRVKALELEAIKGKARTAEVSKEQGKFNRAATMARKSVEAQMEGRPELPDFEAIDNLIKTTALRYNEGLTVDEVINKLQKEYRSNDLMLYREESYHRNFKDGKLINTVENVKPLQRRTKEIPRERQYQKENINVEQPNMRGPIYKNKEDQKLHTGISDKAYENLMNNKKIYRDDIEEDEIYDDSQEYYEEYEDKSFRGWFNRFKDKIRDGFDKMYNRFFSRQGTLEDGHRNARDIKNEVYNQVSNEEAFEDKHYNMARGIRPSHIDRERFEGTVDNRQTEEEARNVHDNREHKKPVVSDRKLTDEEKEEISKDKEFRKWLQKDVEKRKEERDKELQKKLDAIGAEREKLRKGEIKKALRNR